MKQKIAFACYYQKENRYSFNALLGAWDSDPSFNNIDVYFLQNTAGFLSLNEILENHDKTILAFSFSTPEIFEMEIIMAELKRYSAGLKRRQDLLIIAGGPHPSGDPEGALSMGFDAVFTGEGEESLMEFIKTADLNNDYRRVKGIAFLDPEGQTVYTGKRENIDLDLYSPISVKFKLFSSLEISRGCPRSCTFCQTPRLFGNKMRHRSLEQIIRTVKIMKDFHLIAFRAVTPNAFSYCRKDGLINYQALEGLLSSVYNLLKPDGKLFFGSFPSEIRPEDATEENLAFLKKYTDNRQITIGAQFGNDKMLRLSGREHSVETIRASVRSALRARYEPCLDFIFFTPGETPDDLKETFSLIKELLKTGASINTHSFIPLAGTPLYKKYNLNPEYGQIVENELRKLGLLIGNWRSQRKIALKLAACPG